MSSFDTPFFRSLADGHRRWLSQFEPQYLAEWKRLFKYDPEAALCEAAVRERLQRHGVTIEPHRKADPNSLGPDFRCSINGQEFYVEVTCVLIDSATKQTGIPEGGHEGFHSFKIFGLTQAIFQKCGPKTRQCADMDAPVLVAIGTFHSNAAGHSFQRLLIGSVLTGQTGLSWSVDTETGEQGETDQTRLRTLDRSGILALREDTEPSSTINLRNRLTRRSSGPAFQSDAVGSAHP